MGLNVLLDRSGNGVLLGFREISQLADLTETEQNAIARTIKKDIEAHQDLINILA